MDDCAKMRRKLSDEFQQLRKVFLALGDETRQQIFITLLENETPGMRVPEITQRSHLSRPAVSHHLQILKDAGLVSMYRVGTMNFYYADANERCWGSLKALVDHVAEVTSRASRAGYPRMEEDQQF
ncbi:MAG: ArsR/SmtB family transcription factor [Oscillospiraceae bacterium]